MMSTTFQRLLTSALPNSNTLTTTSIHHMRSVLRNNMQSLLKQQKNAISNATQKALASSSVRMIASSSFSSIHHSTTKLRNIQSQSPSLLYQRQHHLHRTTKSVIQPFIVFGNNTRFHSTTAWMDNDEEEKDDEETSDIITNTNINNETSPSPYASEELFVQCEVRPNHNHQSSSSSSVNRIDEVILLENVPSPDYLIGRINYLTDGVTPHRQYNTIQIGPQQHADIQGPLSLYKVNHGSFSDANCVMKLNLAKKQIEFRSKWALKRGSILLWDYNTTEWEFDEPFHDWRTGLNICGFGNLDRNVQEYMIQNGDVSPYIAYRWRMMMKRENGGQT